MSLFSKKLAQATAQQVGESSKASSSSSSSSSSSDDGVAKPWYKNVPSVRAAFGGGVEFLVELNPSLCALNAKWDKERKAQRGGGAVSDAKKSTRFTGTIIGFLGTTTSTSLVSDAGDVCILLAPKNSGSKVYRVGDRFTFTVWGATPLDTSGIVKLRAYANANKDFKMTEPNQFSGYSESVTYLGTSQDTIVKVVPAQAWNGRIAYEMARQLGCTLRPLDPSVVPTEEVWTLYANKATGGAFSASDNGASADEMAARASEMSKKLEGKSDEERKVIIEAEKNAVSEEQARHAKETAKLRVDSQKEAWQNSVPLGHPLALWRRSFFPAFQFEAEKENGETIGATVPVVTTPVEEAFIDPADTYFTDHPEMPYDSKIEIKGDKTVETKISIMPHVCIEIAQQILFKAAGAPEDETDALGFLCMLWSTKLAPLLGVREPHTLYTLARAYFADYKMYISAQIDVEKTIKGFPGEEVTSKNNITGRPWSVVHLDVFEMHSDPIAFMLTRGYELNSKAVIYVLNLFLEAIGEPTNPIMLNTGCFNNGEPTNQGQAKCHPNYRRVLKYISTISGGNSSRIVNMFETAGVQRVWADHMPPLDQTDAFFLVPMRQFAPGEFGYGPEKANTEANLRKFYQDVYVNRSKPQDAAVKPADGISERIMSGDSEQFALPPVFDADGWAVNFTIFQVPRSVLHPNEAQHEATQRTIEKITSLIVESRENSPHADSEFFNMTVEEVFDKMQRDGKHYTICSHRDAGFHEALLLDADRVKRQRDAEAGSSSDKRQRTIDTMGDDDAELEAAMLAAEALHAATGDGDTFPEQDRSILVDTEYSDDENEEEEDE